MKIYMFIGLMLCLLGCGIKKPFSVEDQPLVYATPKKIANNQVVPHSYIVAFNVPKGRRLFDKDYSQEYQRHYLSLAFSEEMKSGVDDINYITSFDLTDVVSLEKDSLDWLGLDNFRLGLDSTEWQPVKVAIMQVDFADENAAQSKLKSWLDNGRIAFAEPNYLSKFGDSGFDDLVKKYGEFRDTSQAPWFEQINLIEAFDKLYNDGKDFENPPLIAVMDSGVDYEHPNLVDNIWQNEVRFEAGCGDDRYGCNATTAFKGSLGDGNVFPVGLSGPGQSCNNLGKTESGNCQHGTHVAGLIAGKTDVAAGYGSICPMCKLAIIRVSGPTKFSDSTGIADSSLIAGFTYVSRLSTADGNNAIRVVNASFGKFSRSRVVESLIRLLKNKSGGGVLVVAAAGNEDTRKRAYPAAFSDVLAVSSVDDRNFKAVSSNYGTLVGIAAPGEADNCHGTAKKGLYSAVPGGEFECKPGTSMAAPIVSGVAGLLLVQGRYSFSAAELKYTLEATADPSLYQSGGNSSFLPSIQDEPYPIPLLGKGLVNARNALYQDVPSSTLVRPSIDRVREGCGILAMKDSDLSNSVMCLIMLLPLLFAEVRKLGV